MVGTDMAILSNLRMKFFVVPLSTIAPLEHSLAPAFRAAHPVRTPGNYAVRRSSRAIILAFARLACSVTSVARSLELFGGGQLGPSCLSSGASFLGSRCSSFGGIALGLFLCDLRSFASGRCGSALLGFSGFLLPLAFGTFSEFSLARLGLVLQHLKSLGLGAVGGRNPVVEARFLESSHQILLSRMVVRGGRLLQETARRAHLMRRQAPGPRGGSHGSLEMKVMQLSKTWLGAPSVGYTGRN